MTTIATFLVQRSFCGLTFAILHDTHVSPKTKRSLHCEPIPLDAETAALGLSELERRWWDGKLKASAMEARG